MEINWIVTIYWLMEAGKGYRFIRYEDGEKSGYVP